MATHNAGTTASVVHWKDSAMENRTMATYDEATTVSVGSWKGGAMESWKIGRAACRERV